MTTLTTNYFLTCSGNHTTDICPDVELVEIELEQPDNPRDHISGTITRTAQAGSMVRVHGDGNGAGDIY